MSGMASPGSPEFRDLAEWSRAQMWNSQLPFDGTGTLHPSISALQSFMGQITNLSADEWYQKIQIQALMFNLGVVISLNCASMAWLPVNDTKELSKLHSDVFEIMMNRNRYPWGISVPTAYAIAFFRRFFENIREKLCFDNENRSKTLAAQSSASALAAWLTHELGFYNPIAVGIAAVCLVTISTAAKKAFCEMSRDDFLKIIDQNHL